MKYSIVLLIVVSNYCMGMEIPLLLNPKENTLSIPNTGWPAESTYVQNSDQDSETNNTTGAECPICHQVLSSKKRLQNLKTHIFSQHTYPTLDQDLKDRIKNCKIEKNGESNFMRCIMEDCQAQFKISKSSQKKFILKQHLANCHFNEPVNSEIQGNPNAANLIKKRTRASSNGSHHLPCPVASCHKKLCSQKKTNLRMGLVTHLFNIHLVPQDENLRKEIEQNWKDQKSKAEISCLHSGCTKKFEVSQNPNAVHEPVYTAFNSMKIHYAMQHCAERVEPFCGNQGIKKYIDEHHIVDNKKQKNA